MNHSTVYRLLYKTDTLPQYRKACARIEEFADKLIAEVESRAATSKDPTATVCLVSRLIEDFKDPKLIRDNVVELSIAGQNMTGTALQWAFAELANDPATYAELRLEILNTFGNEQDGHVKSMIWDNLRACSTLQNVIAETLRLHPVVPTIARTAARDTVLPTGGGLDGKAPIAVPKGATFNCNLYLMHRRKEDWGDDAWEWQPSRWNGRRPGSEYAPFSAGPRICMGQ